MFFNRRSIIYAMDFAVFIALAFALNKILKSYTLEILCYVTLMF